MGKKDKCGCREGKCFLREIDPNSDGLACDSECYFTYQDGFSGGKDSLEWYKKKYPKEYERAFFTEKELRKLKLKKIEE